MRQIAAALICVAFAVAFHFAGAVTLSRQIVRTARSATTKLLDSGVSDIEKERASQRAAFDLLLLLGPLLVRLAVALALAGAAAWILEIAGIAPITAALAELTRWPLIAFATVVMAALFVRGRRGA
jgi:uncharacterized membrane protein YecN with MAPEG domain